MKLRRFFFTLRDCPRHVHLGHHLVTVVIVSFSLLLFSISNISCTLVFKPNLVSFPYIKVRIKGLPCMAFLAWFSSLIFSSKIPTCGSLFLILREDIDHFKLMTGG